VTSHLHLLHLDVSELEAPEPMRQALVALAALSHGQCLVIYHRKNPVPLYPKLTALGFVYRVDIDNKDSTKICVDDYCEDLSVVIKIAFKADELELAALTRMKK